MHAIDNCQSPSSESAPAQGSAAASGQPQQFRDELIYELVKFEGKSQGWVAGELGISQGTVSRAIQRIERRKTQPEKHDAEQDSERFNPEERLRVQRWLTYERNERILASCLRIAHDVEGFLDVSRTTIQRDGLAGGENKVQTVHATLDRSGTAARFLRLAFQINMEQLKLVETDAEDHEEAKASGERESPDSAAPPGGSHLPLAGDGSRFTLAGDSSRLALAVNGATAEPRPSAINGQASNGRASNGQAVNGHAANGNGVGGHAHSAHERIPAARDVSASLPDTYAANGHKEKCASEGRIANGAAEASPQPPERPKRVVHGGMPRDVGTEYAR